MARSVSTPTNASAVCYGYLDLSGHRCESCGDSFNDFTQVDYDGQTLQQCPHCGADEDQCHAIDPQWEFTDLLEVLRAELSAAFPTMTECDRWLDREDHALLGNRFAFIGISEYCGVVAVWITPADTPWDESAGWDALRDRWLAQVAPKFRRIASACLPNPLTQVARFSNGEAIYQPIKVTA